MASESTIFVGANNSGKTSAMDALIMFLKKTKRKELSTTDITLSNWVEINKIGTNWMSPGEEELPALALDSWRTQLPAIDIWLEVDESQIHYVSHIIPKLDWNGGLLGVRLILEPKEPENLYKAYCKAYSAAKQTLANRKIEDKEVSVPNLALWPTSMRDFLDRKLQEFFEVNAYVLNPELAHDVNPQPFTEFMEALDGDPIDGLFKIDIINAQRGFSDPNSGEGTANTDRRLSAQLRHYFDKHLDPNELPDASDLDALEAIESARTVFDQKLKTSFSAAIGELEDLNYPGFSDPKILLSSKVNPLDGLKHDSAVQFEVIPSEDQLSNTFCLPEKYNGLGYQNLISMIFNLIRFRDEWMRVGKAGKREDGCSQHIEPLHLMLIEEPEAHLHAQVQQVFIKKAFGVLRNHTDLKDKTQFTTQMVISTHSSHIAHEANFTGLRYFRRNPLIHVFEVPSAHVVNMSAIFGTGKNTTQNEPSLKSQDQDIIATAQFATRYLKTTHCDLFFADAAILVEGPAERMLVPHFIKKNYPELDRSYVSLLEIGGSHAHKLRPLIEALGIPTLVITDLDSIKPKRAGKARPKIGFNLRTGNYTLKTWAPANENLDAVLNAKDENKVCHNGQVRIAYPCAISIQFNDVKEETKESKSEEAIPYTFEDALVIANLPVFRKMKKPTGLLKKMSKAANKPSLDEACQFMFNALDKNAKKAEMALALLYSIDPDTLNPPQYISEGLEWLKNKVIKNSSPVANREGAE